MKKRADNLYYRVGIYGIHDKINNKIYVGKTLMNFGDRRDSHFSLLRNNKHNSKEMQKDWNEHGEENFEFIVLHDLVDGENINELEIYYIKEYRDKGLAYNIADGGDVGHLKGKHMPEETKRKIGEKNRVNMTGKKLSEETKQKMSKVHKERWNNFSEERKAEIAEYFGKSNKGRKMSPEAKQKLIEREHSCSNAATHTPEQIKEIRRLHEQEGKTNREIADMLGETVAYIGNITAYRRWKYI